MRLHQLLHIDNDSPYTVAICGAGGKTTLLYALAREAAAAGRRTAVYTTTHIMQPDAPDLAAFHILAPKEIEAAWQAGQIAVAGTPLRDGRFELPEPAMRNFFHQRAEACFVEADGSKRLPCKFPDLSHEPVIPRQATQVVLVFGLSALGRPFDSFCHRAVLARKCLQITEQVIDEAVLARLICGGYGHLKPIVLLNQADGAAARARGETVAALLRQAGIEHVCVASLHQLAGAHAQYTHPGETE